MEHLMHDAEMGITGAAKSGKKKQISKKLKRFTPYERKSSMTTLVDMDKFLETPIQLWEGETARALVASPNKPPRKP